MNETIKIIIGGDFAPEKNIKPFNPFSDSLSELFRSSNYCLINLESPLTETDKEIRKTGKKIKNSPKFASILKDAGIDGVTLANNHIRDYDDEGVFNTIKTCRQNSLDFTGAGKNSNDAARILIKKIMSLRVAFLNYCEREFSISSTTRAGANPFDLIDAYRQIRDLRKEVDTIIVIYHGGLEYVHYPTLEMVKTFRFLIDIGADSVVSHHSHRYSGYEIWKGKPICYGLGNLLAHSTSTKLKNRDPSNKGLLVELIISGDIIDFEFHPICQKNDSSSVSLVSHEKKREIIQHIESISQTIMNEKQLTEFWDEIYKKQSVRLFRFMSTNFRILGKILRKIHFKPIMMTSYRRLIWLNILRCDSHRNRAVWILEKSIKDKNSN